MTIKRVLCGFSSYKLVESKAIRTFIELAYYTGRHRPDIELVFAYRDGFPVAGCAHCYNENENEEDARNHFAKLALEADCSHLFMVDSDMSYKGLGDWLGKLVDADRDIVAPLFIRRSAPYDILAMRRVESVNSWTPISSEEAESGKVIEVDATGFGAVMIKTAVLRDMKFPWFVFEIHRGKKLPEDLNFCRKARRAGARIFVDTSIHLDHVGAHVYRPSEGITLLKQREEFVADGIKRSDDSETDLKLVEDGQPAG